ncbi:MAG: hypothetical protein AAF329_25215 [Cyanobacteria bacterium P01_A01_bin.17]
MTITMDHVFILVEPEAKVGDRLLEHGFREGPSNTHPGQGTAIIFVPNHLLVEKEMPFPGWHYQPDYFPAPKGFQVGANSKNLQEPLCFYFPFHNPGVPRPQPQRNSQRITEVVISTPSTDTHGVLALASKCDCLSIQSGTGHLMEITLDHHASGHTADFRPALPLILRW